MSTIAWDGTAFWTTDYSGTNKAFRVDPATGKNIATITLSEASNFMDGMEFFIDSKGNSRLLANQCDACSPGTYDLYDTGGNLIQAAFITAGFGATGVAYDGTNFFISDIFNQRIAVHSGTTGAFIRAFDYESFSAGTNLIEDLSFDYRNTLPPIPEPSTLVLCSAGLALAAFRARKAACKI